MTKIKPEILEVLETAVASRLGVLYKTSDPERFRALLYAARAASGDSRFAKLQFRISPWPEGQVVVVKGGAGPRPSPASSPSFFDEEEESDETI